VISLSASETAATPAPSATPAASGPAAISVQDVSITYQSSLQARGQQTLVGTLSRLRRRRKIVKQVRAVREVSLDVPRGTVLGIIGANGAGKSTLVRAMAGILPPTSGRIEVHGRVSTLLALGVGFDRKLTGRQNVILGGLAAGLSREQLEAKYAEIVEFAELEEFMDMPMRTYSAGMYGRLGFSVAVNMEPDILLIDEALSVGDAHFKRKSFDKMRELCDQAHTIVLVSHGMRAMRELADEVLWLDKGQVKGYGPPRQIIRQYQRFMKVEEDDEVSEEDV
jgi:lipopolysaccharide transport system ATP-binding protein/teichoic acid transport system ATP-binding protein